MIIGAPGSDSDAGMSFLYEHNGNVWSLRWNIVASDQRDSDSFGYAVVVDGRHVFVAAPENDDNGKRNSGSVYYFENVDTPTSAPSISVAPSSQPSGNPSCFPTTSIPTTSPVTSAPTQAPSSSPPTLLPSQSPTILPTNEAFIPSHDGSSSNSILYIVLPAVFFGGIITYLILHLYAVIRRGCLQNRSINTPVVAEVEVLSRHSNFPANPLPNIASVYAIEQITPRERKTSVSTVFPFATHVGDHVPEAEPV